MYANGKLARLEPAVVMDAAAPTHEPQLLVKVISTGEQRCVPRSHLEAYSPAPVFKPGQTVCRAMWSGKEEEATVRPWPSSLGLPRCAGSEAASRPRAREGAQGRTRHTLACSHANAAAMCACARAPDPLHLRQVVRVDSATHVTIRLTGSGITYSSDAFRLRLKTPPAGNALAPAEEACMATSSVENHFMKLLFGWLMSGSLSALSSQRTELLGLLYADEAKQQFGDALRNIQVNTAMPETHAARFMAAWEAAMATHEIRLLLHGSPEENVDSILKHGLRGRAECNTRWLTSCTRTAARYARGAQRITVCATLLPKGATGEVGLPGPIFTINRDEHHVPLFVAQRAY